MSRSSDYRIVSVRRDMSFKVELNYKIKQSKINFLFKLDEYVIIYICVNDVNVIIVITFF